MKTPTNRFGAAVLFVLAIIDLARGSFHWLAPDSGAGIVAGMNLLYPNARDVIFLLAIEGISQIVWGIAYMIVISRAPQFVAIALAGEVLRGLMLLFTEYWLKPPFAPVPGRFMHMATTAVCGVALIYSMNLAKRGTRSMTVAP